MNDSSKPVGFLKARRLWLAQVLACLRAVVLLLLVCTATVQAATPMQSAGGDHTLALKADGTVWAWGNNDDGQLGDGTTTLRSTPVKIALPGGVLATVVSAGERFSLALGADGFVYAWGYDGQGQLGKGAASGNVTANWTPIKIASLSGVTAVEAGAYHVAALKDAGQVWTWGANWSNQLGRNGGANDASPGQVSTLSGTYLAVSAGGAHTVALRNDGAVFSWGANANGQLGNSENGSFPAPALGVGGSGTLTGVAKVDAGRNHTLALLNTGGLVAWGANWAGQLGDGTTTERASPVTVTTTGISANISKIKAGGAHSMLLTDTGAVWGWGYNTVKQVSTGAAQSESLPVSINVSGTASAINAGVSHSGALMSDGTVHSWGHDGKGHRGDGERAFRDGSPRLTLINLHAAAAVSLALQAGSPGSVSASFTLNSTMAGTAYWVLIADDKRPPDYAKIKLAKDGNGDAASPSGSTPVSAGATTLSAALVPGTAYRLFVYVEPSGADCSSSTVNCSNVASLDFSASAGNSDRPTAGTENATTGATAPIAVTITDTVTIINGTMGSTVGSTGTTAGSSSTVTTFAGSLGNSSASKVPVVEYFHAGFGHYFITASAGEIAQLDEGKFQGWARTGQSFNVHYSPDSSDSAVCRFFSGASFSPKSSHFYTPSAAECEMVRQGGVWQYEADPFYVQPPVAGICPAGKQGVYRLYNNGIGGAPNHRYLTSVTIREQMVAQGWIVEGVVFCADN